MKVIKIAIVIAINFLIALFILTAKVKNPEIALYEKTVETLMRKEATNSEQKIKERFPMLIDVQSNINKITKLNQILHSKIRSPSPMMTKEDTLQMEGYRQRLRQLRKIVRTDLSQLLATHGEGRP